MSDIQALCTNACRYFKQNENEVAVFRDPSSRGNNNKEYSQRISACIAATGIGIEVLSDKCSTQLQRAFPPRASGVEDFPCTCNLAASKLRVTQHARVSCGTMDHTLAGGLSDEQVEPAPGLCSHACRAKGGGGDQSVGS